MVPVMDPNDSEDELLAIMLASHYIKRKKSFRKKPRYWVNAYLKERRTKGRYYVDFPDLLSSPALFRENFRVSPEKFHVLQRLVNEFLTPTTSKIRGDHIPATEKLAVTLEYLASGDLLRHLASTYRISKQRLGEIIEETCDALIKGLKNFIPDLTPSSWLDISTRYLERWDFPNCLGSIDGKHCAIKCPKNSGTAFYNYKGFFSVVLMAIADADYRFIYFDVGAYGSEGDSGVFRESDFGKALKNGKLKLPFCKPVDGKLIPFFFVADDAFPLDNHIQKPYKPPNKNSHLSFDQRIFNYRLSRARRTIENAFGILSARWMCLSRTLMIGPERAQKVIAACCLLHNFLMSEAREEYAPVGFSDYEDDNGGIIDGHWRNGINANSLFNNNYEGAQFGRQPQAAKDVRKHLTQYFVSENGRVNWQDQAVSVHSNK